MDADLLVILTDVAGLYERDPRSDPSARLIRRIDHIDESFDAMAGGGHGPGTGGMATKLVAARVATQSGVDVVIANGRVDDVLLSISDGKPEGTLFAAASDRLESRKRWILGNVARGGFIVVDGGAASALRAQGRSLLPAGIARVEGTFERGDAVEIRDADGHRVAAGTANYSSEELARIGGLHSDRIAGTLGYAYGDEAVHRDNMVLL